MAHFSQGQSFLRLYSATRTYLRFTSNSCNRKGLVLGVYGSEKDKSFNLSPIAEKFNQRVNGKLLEYIQLENYIKVKGKKQKDSQLLKYLTQKISYN